jgi:CBS domain-containing protein
MRATIQDVMTTNLVTCPSSATIADAARLMRDRNIGDVLVTHDGDKLFGIVTDRDLVVRCLAEGAGADATLDRACKTSELVSVNPDSGIDDAAKVMRDRSVRRLAVVQDGRAVGIVTLGDLAMKSDPKSALGKISASAPNS